MKLINLKKNKSVKYYLNQMPIEVINIINNNIPIEKKYKPYIKNKKKINKEIKKYCCEIEVGAYFIMKEYEKYTENIKYWTRLRGYCNRAIANKYYEYNKKKS